jgi:hypothetical protein
MPSGAAPQVGRARNIDAAKWVSVENKKGTVLFLEIVLKKVKK